MDFFANLQEGFTNLTDNLYNSYNELKNSMVTEFGRINQSISDGFDKVSGDLNTTVSDLQTNFQQFQDRLKLFVILMVLLIIAIIAMQVWQVISSKLNEKKQLRQTEMMLTELKEIRLLLERQSAQHTPEGIRSTRD